VVSVLVRTEHFSRFFESIHLGSQGAVTLVRDGLVLARASANPAPQNPIGLDISAVLPGPGVMTDTRVVVSPVDGLSRLFHYRRLKEQPLAVIVSETEQDYLAEYRETRTAYGIMGVLTSLGVLGLAWLLQRLALRLDNARRRAEVGEARLHEQHALLRGLIDAVPDLIFMKDLNSVYLGCNPAFSEFAGRPESAQIGKTDFDFFEPATAERFRQNDREMLATGEARHDEEWVTYPDGRTVLFDTLKAPFRGTQGEPLGIIGISRNITERKRAEQGLLLAQSVFDSTNEGIMVTDAEARILSVNPAFSVITGWSATEAIGQKPSLLQSGRHLPEFYADLWQRLAASGHWAGEIWNRRKSGELFVEWMTINAIRDAHGTVSRYVALFSDITLRKSQEEAIWHQANFDPLTGLANRNLFQDRLERALTSGRRKQQQVGLMFLDLDRFKWINDTLGHAAGDLLLIEAAARLQACVREEDTVARMGGDEFTLVLQGLGNQDPLQDVAEKVLAALAQPFVLNGTPQYISASVGVTVYPLDADNTSDLLRNADIAMYQAKGAGRNCYRFYSAHMQEDAVVRVQVEHDLRQALAGGGFALHYQPIIDATSRALLGTEALLRWQHPSRGLVAPADFLSVAEDCGLMVPLGEWVIGQVCRQWRAWADAGYATSPIAINVSIVHFRHPGLYDCIVSAMARYAVPGTMLSLELGEALLLDPDDAPAQLLRDLQALGLRFSLDGFGTGYSSLTVLQRFPLDTVKMDRSLIGQLPASTDARRLVESIIFMAHSLGLSVVAQGVETAAQLDFLRVLGCDRVQGYLTGRPVAQVDADRLLMLAPTAVGLLRMPPVALAP
jgi:diguanylate cyclase (GGDEF)-like protein/PAS domain S-box-containing protein